MRYEELKKIVHEELSHSREGMTWNQLKDSLALPYKTLCPEWIKQLEEDIGLNRRKGESRSLVWSLRPAKTGDRHAK